MNPHLEAYLRELAEHQVVSDWDAIAMHYAYGLRHRMAPEPSTAIAAAITEILACAKQAADQEHAA